MRFDCSQPVSPRPAEAIDGGGRCRDAASARRGARPGAAVPSDAGRLAPSAGRGCEPSELVRYRGRLVAQRTSAKAQVKARLAKNGLHPPVGDDPPFIARPPERSRALRPGLGILVLAPSRHLRPGLQPEERSGSLDLFLTCLQLRQHGVRAQAWVQPAADVRRRKAEFPSEWLLGV